MNQPMRLQDRLLSYLSELDRVRTPDFRHNTGKILAKLYIFQQVKHFAEERLKAYYLELGELQIPEVKGDYVLAESPSFILTGKVSAPRHTVDPDLLANAMARRFDISVADALAFITVNKKKNAGSVTKVVIQK